MKRNERLALLTSQRALQAAVQARDYAAVRRWLAGGGDPKALWQGERWEDTYPMVLAVEGNDLEMVHLPAEAGMPLYHNALMAQKRYGAVEPLTVAALWRPGCHEAVMAALDLGAAIHSTTQDHMPVLRLTQLHERELDARSDALFQRILDAGVVDVDAPWDDSLRILHIICMGNNRYVPELIRLSRDVNTPDTSALRLTPLRTAVTSGSDLAVGALLARGADPSTPVSKDKTLLDQALHIKEFKREKNLSGQVDRIIAMLETGRALPEFTSLA
ncbi:ankyrin repeat domain-containing protein [Acidovorax sp.]|uniref:ankyrin repeat domain-containing protein n=1 Tax=Acidovorax sp. TaxID=1872122 RepID=UPI0025C1F953|nr:ankyrin repeat domain-containing protein [Acidovorax sp.]MCI5069481.1 ankyrin repeat domain-containing protein [Acidovorax sp.]